ncbi:hypothetical protein Airi01_023390 [Actinoallomurus iriomotensis]|uniref:Uncharacterized protein n=1 Tax=Actinoallomurus iriomotensis TaxID=478107 RepID=A0A9W6RHB8_9ACTN|nr:hypothetical protein Airi01_023390 [Actinoallomurus iriomotensis]
MRHSGIADAAIIAVMADERCMHDMLPGQCGQRPCRDIPQGLVARVYVTEGGDVLHRSPDCRALREGQLKAARRGQQLHEPRSIDVIDALGADRAVCIQCFPDYVPEGTKLCWVRGDDGRWVPGLLTRWKHDADRWRGWVSYLAETGQVTTLKDQDDLRPREVGERPPRSGDSARYAP